MASLSDAAVANPLARVVTPPASVVEPGKVLVVDDSEPNRDLLSRRLRRQGHTVETASNGREALEKVAAGDFDVVLLDVMMPEMNGYQVLERLKSDRALRHIPVIMITAIDEMESIIRCIDSGTSSKAPPTATPALCTTASSSPPVLASVDATASRIDAASFTSRRMIST
jgi:CheY-like chemotaxis protein